MGGGGSWQHEGLQDVVLQGLGIKYRADESCNSNLNLGNCPRDKLVRPL